MDFDTLLWFAVLFVAIYLAFRFYEAFQENRHPRMKDVDEVFGDSND